MKNKTPALSCAITAASSLRISISRMSRAGAAQNYGSVGLGLLFEELTRCSLFNYIAQLHKLIYPLFWLHVTPTPKVVHCRSADRARDHFALIEHREFNDHPIEVVALYLTSLKRHRKGSMPNESL
ncbi:MAG: hypothetical protein WBX95_09310 [Xanthobacteraceae bacterium]